MRSTSIEYKDNSKRVQGKDLQIFEVFKTHTGEKFMFIGNSTHYECGDIYNSILLEDSGVIYQVREEEYVDLLKAKLIIEI